MAASEGARARGGRLMLLIAGLLVAAAVVLHVIHYLIFRDVHHIMIYLLGDLAFLPIEILIVVIVVERVLAHHEKGLMLQKMNMLIGMFFEEVGVRLLGTLTQAVSDRGELLPCLAIRGDWTEADFRRGLAGARAFNYRVDAGRLDLEALRDALIARRNLLAMLLGNPNLLEHERFTDLLWALFHLTDELSVRKDLSGLPESDLKHLAGDVERVCRLLTVEWLHYCRHLQSAYPYIFSIVVRTHPLQEHPDPVVR